MTNLQIEAIEKQIPEGERIDRMYTAYEGDIRVITKDQNGYETRYTTRINSDGDIVLERM